MQVRLTLIAMMSMTAAEAIAAQTPYGTCPERAQYYQERYESTGRAGDLVCMQKAMERELADSSEFECPLSAEHYQTAYESSARAGDLVCMQQALTRELQ